MTKATGLNKRVEAQDYIIYPNPAEQTVTIKSNHGSIADEVVFYNLQGNKVLQTTPEQSITTIDLGDLKLGVYIIKSKLNKKRPSVFSLMMYQLEQS
ncbi:hypothetical protein CW751_06660 [Brumimicrobium salinarum]|uniref:Secretion system C-terminal sorting domain-containing protein n=2 Tax=Brumimicrobium salinarum TaxID=2058658 RepID=A0A2I0R4D4_9FLAO|nr:hypothetical protein CW751_06660 [Brumimicrobium salinarum]